MSTNNHLLYFFVIARYLIRCGFWYLTGFVLSHAVSTVWAVLGGVHG